MAATGSKGKVVIIIEHPSSTLYQSIEKEFKTGVVSVVFDGKDDSSVKKAVMEATKEGKLVIIRVRVVSPTENIQGSTEIAKFKSAFKLEVLCYAFLGIKDAADAMADNTSGGMIVFASSSHSPEKSLEPYRMWCNHALVGFAKSYTSGNTSGKGIEVEYISADKSKTEAEVAKKVVEFYTASKTSAWGIGKENKIRRGGK